MADKKIRKRLADFDRKFNAAMKRINDKKRKTTNNKEETDAKPTK